LAPFSRLSGKHCIDRAYQGSYNPDVSVRVVLKEGCR
jgi:hypothetical protein